MVGTFETSQAAPGYGNHFRVEVSGEYGTIAVLSGSPKEIWMFVGKTLSRDASWTTCIPSFAIPTTFASHQGTLDPSRLVDVIQKKTNDYPSFEDGVRAQKVLDGIFKSEKSKRWVRT
jgi:predicted dehydrogenase